MNMIVKALGALAIAGTVAMGGSAFTAGGVTKADIESTAGFIGGTVGVASTGASLTDVVYDFTSSGTAQEAVNNVNLTFAATVATRDVTVILHNTGDTSPETISCTVAGGGLTAACPTADPLVGFPDLQTLNVTVA